MADHPSVIFKDGPSGRRAALAYGPDVWEIIKFLREVDERGPAALDAAAEVLAVDASRIAAAVSYYTEYPDEIDADIAEADDASARAEEIQVAADPSSGEDPPGSSGRTASRSRLRRPGSAITSMAAIRPVAPTVSAGTT